MFDIFEPDTRGATCRGEPSSTIDGFVAVEAPAGSAMSERTSSATPTYVSSASQTGNVKTTSTSVQTSHDLYAEDIYIGSYPDLTGARPKETVEDKTTPDGPATISQESDATPKESTTTVQEPVAIAQEPAALVQQSATTAQVSDAQETPESTQLSQSPSPAASKSPSPSSAAASSDSSTQQILDAIPFRDHYPDQLIMRLRDGRLCCQNGIEEAEKAKDGTFEGATVLDWKIGLRKVLITTAIREKENNDWNEKTRLQWLFPAGVRHGMNATDPRICDDLQGLAANLVTDADLQDAIEGWRDTVDGRADGYGFTAAEHEDSDGIDNNTYDDYFPAVPRKVVYHSTGVRTAFIQSPMVYEIVYGREPTKSEQRQITRTVGTLEYKDHTLFSYGMPFLKPNGPHPDVQTETQDSAFQTMAFEFREGNIIKAKAKAGMTAIKLNKICVEREQDIRVYAEPSKDKIVHSQQFNKLRAIIEKDGFVRAYGEFEPTIHNVLYKDIEKKPVATAANIPSKTLDTSAPPQSKTKKMKAEKPKMIKSYCRSPSPGPYDDTQMEDPEMFEIGWPSNRFPLTEVDGTYSEDVVKDFGLPNPSHFHKAVPRHTPSAIATTTSATVISTPAREQKDNDISVANDSPRAPATVQIPSSTQKSLQAPAQQRQKKHDTPVASESSHDTVSVQGPSTTQKTLQTPTQQEGQGKSRKRSMGESSDEGYKSLSSSKRQKHEEHTVAAASHFSKAYDTPLSADDVKVAAATPTASSPPTVATATSTASSKRKRDVPIGESTDKTEKPNSKRLKVQTSPTPLPRRLPPNESTLKIVMPKSMLNIRAAVNQRKAQQAARSTAQKAPIEKAPTEKTPIEKASIQEAPVQKATIGNGGRQPERVQQQESAREIQQPLANPSDTEPSQAPAILSRLGWASRKPSSNRNKENPNRWRNDLGAISGGSRYEPYNPRDRRNRRN